MALIYVTGIAGSGKSAVQKELAHLGYEAFDEDDPEIGSAHNKQTNEAVRVPPLEQRTPQWFAEHEWRVFPESIRKLKDRSKSQAVFLCGNAASEQQLLEFDKVVLLDIDEQTLRDRINSRKDNNFGQSEHELQIILDRNEKMKKIYGNAHLVIIDATQALSTVVSRVIAASQY